MKNKGRDVFIVGAGFSAPAKIPIQNKIIKEISRPTSEAFLSFEPPQESIKFLMSYIRVGLFLLQEYTSYNCDKEYQEFSILENEQLTSGSIAFEKDDRYRKIQILKEQIRSNLEKADIQISLEDIFTSFDKSFQGREYINRHTYYQIDKIRDSITRLFVYYFSRRINAFSYDLPDYDYFFKYVKKLRNATIISTNWDVLIEEYFIRKKIKYNLCLNETYFAPSDKKDVSKNDVNLVKLHGSINWFKCLNCGTLNIVENEKSGRYLFEDKIAEHCAECGCSNRDETLLQSEIITPTMIKSINSQLYNNLWAAAKRDLRMASSVTFVGYSLPTADFEFRYLLKRSIPQDAKINVILHDTDNPDNTNKKHLQELLPEKRYRDLFSQNEMSFHYDGFERYFADLC